jgi:4-hydroxy-2-oxoheptanedioate aldolase
MRPNALREIWGRGEVALNCWLSAAGAVQAEALSRQGFDAITVDLQHGAVDHQDAQAIFIAISGSATVPVCRVPWNDPAAVMRVLDAGAYGVICPMINTAADAEAFVRAARYPPRGERSFGPLRALVQAETDWAGYFAEADRTIVTIGQIETAEALENIEEIVAVDGLDAVYVGTVDLLISTGGPAALDHASTTSAAMHARIVTAAHAAGVKVGLHAVTDDDVRRCAAHGADLVTVAHDIVQLATGTAERLARARAVVTAG